MEKPASRILLAILFLGQASLATALPQSCQWDIPVQSGGLDVRIINEASGMEPSTAFPGRLYHVNDSGDRGRFYMTGLGGAGTAIVNVASFVPLDVEDMTLGPCGSVDSTCLFIADIGDNFAQRSEIEIVAVEEQAEFADPAVPAERIRLTYPDGPHDAEALAIHPNGDIYIISKERSDALRRAYPSRIYRLPIERRLGASGRVEQLDLLGQVDFTVISGDPYSGSIPTAMDISGDGARFIVLTYENAFEFYLDLSNTALPLTEDLVEGVDFREIPLRVLEQQESIAYLGDGAFLYDTEQDDREAQIMRVRCR